MRLTKIEDPRDNLDKANRDQLYRFAVSRGVREINDRIYNGGNAADLMRLILRQKGMTDISIPHHQLGMPPQTAIEEQPSRKPAVMMDDILKQQLKEMQTESAPVKKAEPEKPVSSMDIRELRSACKSRGIRMARTDNIQKLREKLNGQAID